LLKEPNQEYFFDMNNFFYEMLKIYTLFFLF
jgi:hypothetical protein